MCLTHHRRCVPMNQGLLQYYPTRLLDLHPGRTDVDLCLRITNQDPPDSSYMTLSHCWGTANFLKLTNATLKYFKEGLKIKELSQTFQDAVQITREVGVRFLWIDALCIIQDSRKDWSYESAMMTKVYENSHCNIAAANAANSEQGCFSQRDISSIPPIIVEINWTNTFNRTYLFHDDNFWERQLLDSPLFRRAWVVQERILAPGTLYYGQDQLLWDCSEMGACETYPDGDPNRLSERTKSFDLNELVSRRSLPLTPELKKSIYEYWHQILEDYTKCDLTKAKDKLVAVSGLAKRVQSFLGDDYLAGLWKESLPSELLWYSYHTIEKPPTRPNLYLAPSWSWASVKGPVKWEVDSRLPEWSAVNIIASGIDLATTDFAGQVTNGFIRLIGRPIAGYLRTTPSSLTSTTETTLHLSDLNFELVNIVYLDSDLEPKYEKAGVFFLPVTIGTESWTKGLVLELVDPVRNTYRRLGYARLFQRLGALSEPEDLVRSYIDSFSEQIMTLI